MLLIIIYIILWGIGCVLFIILLAYELNKNYQKEINELNVHYNKELDYHLEYAADNVESVLI